MPGDGTIPPEVRRMTKIIPNPQKIEIDFADAQLTGQGGWALLAHAARWLDLPRHLAEAIRIKLGGDGGGR